MAALRLQSRTLRLMTIGTLAGRWWRLVRRAVAAGNEAEKA
ncbi:MAG TPA: hypothetical protein VK790_06930 [Solirubrobacteraceae bacterium]|nr:hypothetical protein [Solirubrobacteraceae bacterium]